MSHLEEEFYKIEKEHGWNTIFNVSFIYLFYLRKKFFFIETCK